MTMIGDQGTSFKKLINPLRWSFFASILWRVFDHQDGDMFGHYADITVRVPFVVAWYLAFEKE